MTENASNKKSFADRAAGEPSELHKLFAEWIKKQTGYEPDLKTIQLAVTMRMDFQASPENQAALAERKAESARKAEEVKAKRLAKLEAELAKLKGETVADDAKPEEPAEAPKDDAESKGEAEVENAPEAATEAAEEPKKAAPARRTRRTAAKK